MSFPDAALQSEFLRGIPPQVCAQLKALGQVRAFPPGCVIFAEGAIHTDFHLITEGHVRLDMLVPCRGHMAILTAGPGDVLAWSALVCQSVMTSTAVALEPVKAVTFPADALRQLCEQNHEIGYHVMRQLAAALSRRLVATRLQLLDLFDAPAKPRETPPIVGRPGDDEC